MPAATSRPLTTPTALTQSSSRTGRGPRSTPLSPRSCRTCGTSPTGTTFAATSSSRRVSSRPPGTSRQRAGSLVTDRGDQVICRFYVMASGCLSLPKSPEHRRCRRFRGDVYYTSRWPHEGVDFTGKRVAVIGTGSSGIQSIPLIAAEAAQLTVFQRTAELLDPGPQRSPGRRTPRRAGARPGCLPGVGKWSRGGVPAELTDVSGVTATAEVRRARFEAAWEAGELFADPRRVQRPLLNPASNDIVAEMIREKIRIDRRSTRRLQRALPLRPSVRHEATLPRQQLLPDLQPASRSARRPPQGPDHRPSPSRGSIPLASPSSSMPSSTPPGSTP